MSNVNGRYSKCPASAGHFFFARTVQRGHSCPRSPSPPATHFSHVYSLGSQTESTGNRGPQRAFADTNLRVT
jgi:hypothetical protein